MKIHIRFYYDIGSSNALLPFLLQFVSFSAKFRIVAESPSSGIGVLGIIVNCILLLVMHHTYPQTVFYYFQRHEPDSILRENCFLSFEGFAKYLMDKDNYAYIYEKTKHNDEVKLQSHTH